MFAHDPENLSRIVGLGLDASVEGMAKEVVDGERGQVGASAFLKDVREIHAVAVEDIVVDHGDIGRAFVQAKPGMTGDGGEALGPARIGKFQPDAPGEILPIRGGFAEDQVRLEAAVHVQAGVDLPCTAIGRVR